MHSTSSLFDPVRHEALGSEAWHDQAVPAAIDRIVQAAVQSFTADGLWPLHPLDDMPPEHTAAATGLYEGAAGVIWACRFLQRQGASTVLLPDWDATVRDLTARRHRENAVSPDEAPSFFIGDSGTLLLEWQQSGDAAVADRLYACVRSNLHHKALEALWGNPGSVIAAVHMAEATDDPRWPALVREALPVLAETLHADPETGTPIWTQDLYGRTVRYLGAGHGLVGNVYAALRSARWLEPALLQRFTDAAQQTLGALALRDDQNGINWHPMSDRQRVQTRIPLVHDCHGAPGVLNRLAGMLPGDAAWDAVLLGAGELVWRAGPLSKGPGLCHGTAGSALALLKLAQRSGDAVWRDRARALAWHAAGQVERQWAQYGRCRASLWTGDLGVAFMLWACLNEQAVLPTLDVF